MVEKTSGKWEQIKSRVLNTPERLETYERKKRALIATRQMLMEIDAERERMGFTKAELARQMGTTPSVVRRVFSSKSSNPTLRTVLDMADALGLRLELKTRRNE